MNLEVAITTNVDLSEPDLGDSNWVGLLGGRFPLLNSQYMYIHSDHPNPEYRAAHPFNGCREVSYTDTPTFDSRFQCHVTIPEDHHAVLPGRALGGEYGLREDGSTPSFARKKDAKKYAAKCAVECLRANGLMPPDGVKFPKTQALPKRPNPQSPASGGSLVDEEIASQKKQRTDPLFSPTATATTAASTASTTTTIKMVACPFDENRPSATYHVSQLCNELGLTAPTYQYSFTDDRCLFWSCHADFGDDHLTLPFDASRLIRVENMISKAAAREKIAEDLLPYLQEEKARRQTGDRAFMKGLGA